MNSKNKIKDSDINKDISRIHITAYLDRIRLGLFLALLFILVSELVMYVMVKSRALDLSLGNTFIKSRWTPNFIYVERHLIIQNAVNWLVFGISLIFYNKVGFKGKKKLISVTFMIITTVYCFGHWGYIFLSLIYIIPVIFSCPLGKKYRTGILVASIIMTVIYGFYQNALVKTGYHILIAVVSITVIIATHLISGCIYSSFVKAIKDIEEYSKLSDELYNEIAHDFVTGAFSKAALHQDITRKDNLTSLAFIDIDDFKEVNDTMGHSTGDSILQNLVRCCQKEKEQVYRYGGDEFIILSKLPTGSLIEKLDFIKTSYTDSCKRLYNCNSTFSAGVMEISNNKEHTDIEKILTESDKIMYEAKHNGKNRILAGA